METTWVDRTLAIKNLDPEYGGSEEGDVGAQESLNTTVQTPLDSEIHIAFVYDSDGGAEGGPVLQHYRDGELVTIFDVTVALGNLNDVNNWIGRSNNLGENNFQGLFNEFRIYDYALSNNQILGNIEAGPDEVNVGNAILGDYDDSGELDEADLNLQALQIANPPGDPDYDLNEDGAVNYLDRQMWINDLKVTWIGDANLDLEFNSSDMVQVFSKGKYEKDDEDATWGEGDWNGNLRFDSGDMVAAFVAGGYELGQKGPAAAVSSVPEPSSILLLMLGVLALGMYRKR